jgi:hypothetical protein
VVENPLEERSYNVIERTCRVVMDVKIRISQITPENVAGYFKPCETGEGLPWEWAERQNGLLLALLNDEEVLDQFLAGIAQSDLGFLLDSKRIKSLSDEEENDLFERVYRGLDRDDRLFFEEVRKDGILYDNLQLIHKAFVTAWKETEVVEVLVVKQDNTQEEA